MSENAVNLSNCKLSKTEATLLPKGWKVCPILHSADQSVLKEDLKKIGTTWNWRERQMGSFS